MFNSHENIHTLSNTWQQNYDKRCPLYVDAFIFCLRIFYSKEMWIISAFLLIDIKREMGLHLVTFVVELDLCFVRTSGKSFWFLFTWLCVPNQTFIFKWISTNGCKPVFKWKKKHREKNTDDYIIRIMFEKLEISYYFIKERSTNISKHLKFKCCRKRYKLKNEKKQCYTNVAAVFHSAWTKSFQWIRVRSFSPAPNDR